MFHGTADSFVPLKWGAKKFLRLYPNIEAHYYDGVDRAYDKKTNFGGRYYLDCVGLSSGLRLTSKKQRQL